MRKTLSALAVAALLLPGTPLLSSAQNAIDQTSNSVDKATNTINKVGSLFKKKKKTSDSTVAKPAVTPDNPNTNITINSGYDFVPGTMVIFNDIFDSTGMGKFPVKWITDASGEVVTLQQYPGNWFSITSNGMYLPKLKGGLPKDFTVEFDLILANATGSHSFYVDFEDALNHNFDRYPNNPFLQIRIYDHGNAYIDSKGRNLSTYVRSNGYNEGGKINHVAIRKQGERLLLYINQEKTFDINHAFEDQRTYSTFKFSADFTNPMHFLISNVRIAGL